jgi:CarD family transcriptional regulator
MFSTGDTVVYPHHGAGRVLDIVEQEFHGKPRRYYSIQILHSEMTVMVPVDLSDKAGIRPVMSEPMVERVLGVLREDPTGMPDSWNRRVKHNQEKNWPTCCAILPCAITRRGCPRVRNKCSTKRGAYWPRS